MAVGARSRSGPQNDAPNVAAATAAGLRGATFGARSAARDLVGCGGYWHFRGGPDPELLYGVAESEWGRGLATEIGGAVLAYGVERLGLREVRASTDAPNAASARVLEKLGFRLERRAVADGLDTLFFRYAADVPPPA
jgi:RimJ/RimL family protein N-acetyltransferase